MNRGDYIVYVDESGDHGLKNINPQYPIFSLAFCVFKKANYIKDIAPKLNELKFKYWGHCDIVMHEHDIRKNRSGDWSILDNPNTRSAFLNDISDLIQTSAFDVIASVIVKQRLTRYQRPENPYELAMLFCMEHLNNFLLRNNQSGKEIHIQFESRGKVEDMYLECEFRRICENASNAVKSSTNFSQINYHIRFLDKKSNSTGLQIADLIARPIGLHVLRPEQENRAFEIIKEKLITHNDGNYDGSGLKIFP